MFQPLHTFIEYFQGVYLINGPKYTSPHGLWPWIGPKTNNIHPLGWYFISTWPSISPNAAFGCLFGSFQPQQVIYHFGAQNSTKVTSRMEKEAMNPQCKATAFGWPCWWGNHLRRGSTHSDYVLIRRRVWTEWTLVNEVNTRLLLVYTPHFVRRIYSS